MTHKRITVGELMTTGVISLKETDTLGRVHLEMHIASIRHIPVVDERNHVVGIVSNRDIIGALGKRLDMHLRVGELMTRTVRTVHPTLPAHEAAGIMLEAKFGSLPVVGDDEQLIGIVTETDFLAVAQQALRGAPLTDRSPYL